MRYTEIDKVFSLISSDEISKAQRLRTLSEVSAWLPHDITFIHRRLYDDLVGGYSEFCFKCNLMSLVEDAQEEVR